MESGLRVCDTLMCELYVCTPVCILLAHIYTIPQAIKLLEVIHNRRLYVPLVVRGLVEQSLTASHNTYDDLWFSMEYSGTRSEELH